MKDQRILITGGAGLIGSHIADLVALERPREILILDNFVRGRRENLAQAASILPLTIIEGDALKVDFETLAPAGEPVRIIANLPYNVGTQLLVNWLLPKNWPPFWFS